MPGLKYLYNLLIIDIQAHLFAALFCMIVVQFLFYNRFSVFKQKMEGEFMTIRVMIANIEKELKLYTEKTGEIDKDLAPIKTIFGRINLPEINV